MHRREELLSFEESRNGGEDELCAASDVITQLARNEVLMGGFLQYGFPGVTL